MTDSVPPSLQEPWNCTARAEEETRGMTREELTHLYRRAAGRCIWIARSGRFSTPRWPASGHRSLCRREAGGVIARDTLIGGSVGRTGFHYSNHEKFFRNLREKLMTLPDEPRIHSGHSPVTTIGQERRFDPYLQG